MGGAKLLKKIEIIAQYVEKRDYFCIVKRFTYHLKTTALTVIAAFWGIISTYANEKATYIEDSVAVSLLTCSPHDEVYSLYGHTALRYKNLRTGEDWAFNYGVFDFRKSYFVLRFTFGITDYELGVIPFEYFIMEYKKFGSQITEQVINMTAEEKTKIYEALKNNLLPQNRVYRYNFYYDNCTTRARNMIESCINGTVEYADSETHNETYREMIHEKTKNYPWAEFGNDLCLGLMSDVKTDIRQQQFLPENLMRDFSKAKINRNGKISPLVEKQVVVLEPGLQVAKDGFPLSPTTCMILFFALSLTIAAIELKRKKTFRLWDVSLMLATGVCGILILALFVSEHPTTSTNLQILLLNPLPLLFVTSVAKGRKTIFWIMQGVLAILFLAGGIIQDYAAGMPFLALSLLLRAWINIKHPHQQDIK